MAEGGTHPAPQPPSRITVGVSLKLYLDVAETTQWARKVATIARNNSAVREGRVRLFVMPSFPALTAVHTALAGTRVQLGAQNLHWEDRGPYTGEVSGADLRAVGCGLVEVGHAERRASFGESEDVVRDKLTAAVRNGLVPVLCIGEETQLGIVEAVAECAAQLRSALAGLPAESRSEVIVAYEPVWAIGKKEPADAAHVRGVVAQLRNVLADDGRIPVFSVIYGGSAQRGTLNGLGGAVDGLFLGRFAHDTAELARVIDEAASLTEFPGRNDGFAADVRR